MLELLKEARKKSHVTQNEVAEKMGVVRSVIGKIERGERRIDVIELRKFCSAIGLPLPTFIARLEGAFEREGKME